MNAVTLGQKAEEILRNAAFVECIAALEKKYTDQWLHSRPDDEKGRESCFEMIRAVREVRDQMQVFADNGRLEKLK